MKREEKTRLKQVVKDAFLKVHGKRSTDDVIIDDDLNQQFIAACIAQLPDVSPDVFNWCLYNLRKASGIGPVAERRERQRHDEYLHAAEIAARFMEDKYKSNTDRVLCNPALRNEFDRVAQSIAPEVSTYLLRKAALKLRKARKLRPEKTKRIVDWGLQVLTFTAEELCRNLTLIPRQPGVYFFRDRTGYLYNR